MVPVMVMASAVIHGCAALVTGSLARYRKRYSEAVDTAEFIRQARLAAGLTQTELARRAGTSQPAVARYESGEVSPSVRTLERLLCAVGRQLRLATEPDAAVVSQISERRRRLHDARESIERAVRRVGASNVRVFGSVARGQDRPDSDVDLIVDFDVRAHGALPLIRLRRELGELLGERVDLVASDLLLPDVAARALAEAVPL